MGNGFAKIGRACPSTSFVSRERVGRRLKVSRTQPKAGRRFFGLVWLWTLVVMSTAVAAHPALGADAGDWKAGVAAVKITPERPMWMSGYAARTKPAGGTLNDLYAKALAIEDPSGRRAVLVTMDLIGIDRDFSRRVCRAVQDKHKLLREAIALSTSHSHSGPVVGRNLQAMYFLDDEQQRRVDEYTAALETRLIALAGDALGRLAPAKLEWAAGRATFAVNRRNNPEKDVPQLKADGLLKGPVDHDLPVLAVKDADGKLIAAAFGYACHATTLDGYEWSGDWPGFAQAEMERAHPGAVALFWAGCGADQNPIPRRSVEFAKDYGRQAAAAVDAALGGEGKAVAGGLSTAYQETDLPLGELPTREKLAADLKGDNKYAARRAKLLLEAWDKDGRLSPTYPYPVQLWRLGDGGPTWVFLGGEVVVDYALRLKQELGAGTTWVAAYGNDVMAYIPSARVLKEGGYEGGGAMVYYGLPAPWGEEVEGRIVKAVREVAGKL